MISANKTARAKVSYHLAFPRLGTNLENTLFHKNGPNYTIKLINTSIKRANKIALPCLAYSFLLLAFSIPHDPTFEDAHFIQ